MSFAAMSSAAGLHQDNSNTSLNVLKPFLNWCPQPLMKAKDHSRSDSTRTPNHFDRHLHEKLILKKVVHRPSIASDLAKGVLATLEEFETKHGRPLPPTKPNFINLETLRILNTVRQKHGAQVRRETDVSSLWINHFSEHALNVAVTLACGSEEWGAGPFIWSETACGTVSAKADAFLQLSTTAGSTQLEKMGLVHAFDIFRDLATIEFKSLMAGDHETLSLMHQLQNEPFSWEGCENCTCPSSEGYAQYTRGARMGYDIFESDEIACSCPPPKPLSAAKIKRTAEKLKHARLMTQQLWANSVATDSTFILLHSGNHEVIAIRDRDAQTLYISDVIDVTNPSSSASKSGGSTFGYGQLQVGFLLGVIMEAQKRSQRLRESLDNKDKAPPVGWVTVYDSPAVKDDSLPLHRQAPEGKKSKAARLPQVELLFRAQESALLRVDDYASTKDISTLDVIRSGLYKRYKFPAEYDEQLQIEDFSASSSSAVITLPMRRGDGFVKLKQNFRVDHLIYLAQQAAFPKSRGFFVKLAREDTMKFGRLDTEFRFHAIMKLKHKLEWLPRIVGLFAQTEDECIYHILVMEHAGEDVNRDELTSGDIQSLSARLGQVHKLGFTHGSLSSEHIRRHPSNGLVIVSWGHASRSDDAHDFENEQNALKLVLQTGNPIPSHKPKHSDNKIQTGDSTTQELKWEPSASQSLQSSIETTARTKEFYTIMAAKSSNKRVVVCGRGTKRGRAAVEDSV